MTNRQVMYVGAAILALVAGVVFGARDVQAGYCVNPATGNYQNCWRDDRPDPTGSATCDELGGFCRNRMCICGQSDPGICSDRCADRGLTCPSGNCRTQHVTDCRGIASGGGGGVISYCQVDNCVAGYGNACSRCNSCGMCNSGSILCGGGCSVSAPSDALCGVAPIGWEETANCSVASGWAFDGDYAGAVSVHLYEGATFLGSTTANLSRPDVGAIYPGRTNSGWSWTIPPALKNGLNHSITAYAINVNAAGSPQGANPQLSGSPKVINCNQPPTGTLSTAVCGSPNGTATGTASDPQSGTVTTVIYDGQAGAGGVQIGVGNATPNFSISFPSFSNGQTHNIYAYGQDVPAGTWHQLGGSIPLTCAPTVTLSAAPATVNFAEPATITWNVRNATSCTASPAGSWYNPASLVNGIANSSGSTGPLITNTTFTLTCQNAVGTQTVGSVTVNVNIPPPTGAILDVNDTDYCTAGAGMVIDWQYDSPARPISAYRIEILDDQGTVVHDTGKVAKVAATPEEARVATEPTRLSRWSRISGALISSMVNIFVPNK